MTWDDLSATTGFSGAVKRTSSANKKRAKPPLRQGFEKSLEFDAPDAESSARINSGGSARPKEDFNFADSSEPAATPSFFFELQGEGVARGDEAVWGKAFDLLFNYGRASADALAVIKETKLDAVRKGEVALGVESDSEGPDAGKRRSVSAGQIQGRGDGRRRRRASR